MPLPWYYNELYVALCSVKDGRIKGSGICYDGISLVTCAHVLNSAAGRAQTDMSDAVGLEVDIRFSQSTKLDRSRRFKARVTVWGPSTAPAGTKFTPRYDVAVLELLPETAPEELIPFANELRFIADDLRENYFSCTSHNTLTPDEDIVPINGTITQYLPAEGKTALSTSANTHDAFLKPGSSGSPVYSETLNGIAGIADQLVENAQDIRYAFMIDARRLADFIPDIIVHQPSLKKKSRADKKFRCDRQKVIEGIHTERSRSDRKGNLFFLWGDDEQEGKAFSRRYELEFIRPVDTGNSSISIEVDLPSDISNLGFFQSGLLEMLSNAAANSNKKIMLKPEDDIFKAGEALKHVRHKVFFFKIIDFSNSQTPCYDWFFRSFLKAGQKAYPDDLHVMVLFEFSEYDPDAKKKREELFGLFGNPAAFPLEDVTKQHIKSWISQFGEDEESPFITKLKELLRRPENELPMIAVYEQFDDAVRELSNHERI